MIRGSVLHTVSSFTYVSLNERFDLIFENLTLAFLPPDRGKDSNPCPSSPHYLFSLLLYHVGAMYLFVSFGTGTHLYIHFAYYVSTLYSL